MDRSTFLDKVGEGLVVGIMVALVITVGGVVWNGFEDAKKQLNAANQILDTQVNRTNETFSEFNREQNIRNRNQDRINKKQSETNQQILMAIERLESTVSDLSRRASVDYEPAVGKESLDKIGADNIIQRELDSKQIRQEQIQEQTDDYQDHLRMQQKAW